MVFRDDATLRVINPVFWSGISIASGVTNQALKPTRLAHHEWLRLRTIVGSLVSA